MLHSHEEEFQVLAGLVFKERGSLSCNLPTGLCDYLKGGGGGVARLHTPGRAGPEQGGSYLMLISGQDFCARDWLRLQGFLAQVAPVPGDPSSGLQGACMHIV